MFILDSLMISGIRWALETTLTAAEAEMNDDSVLREQLLEAEMRRETGEISDDDFRDIEADLLARIREIKERRAGGSGPLALAVQPMETGGDSTFQVEASISGDFHDPAAAPHTTVIAPLDAHHAVANLVSTTGSETITVLDMEPGDAVAPVAAAEPLVGGSAARNPPHEEKSGNPPHREASGNLLHREKSGEPPHREKSGKPRHRDKGGNPPHRDASGKPSRAKARGKPSPTSDRRKRPAANDGRPRTATKDAAAPSAGEVRVPRRGPGRSERSRVTSRRRAPGNTP